MDIETKIRKIRLRIRRDAQDSGGGSYRPSLLQIVHRLPRAMLIDLSNRDTHRGSYRDQAFIYAARFERLYRVAGDKYT